MLGNRSAVLGVDLESPLIICHAVEEKNEKVNISASKIRHNTVFKQS